MSEVYAIEKATQKIKFTAGSLFNMKDIIKMRGLDENDFIFLEELGMRYVSRIAFVDGECIYNNRVFWTLRAPDLVETYEEHEVKDFLGNDVDLIRFQLEMNSNQNRIASIDNTAGEVEYNMIIGNELISLLREECIDVGHGSVTPESMFLKMFQVISALQIGCFREVIPMLDAVELDEFFTEERITKYKQMITAADVITYDK